MCSSPRPHCSAGYYHDVASNHVASLDPGLKWSKPFNQFVWKFYRSCDLLKYYATILLPKILVAVKEFLSTEESFCNRVAGTERAMYHGCKLVSMGNSPFLKLGGRILKVHYFLSRYPQPSLAYSLTPEWLWVAHKSGVSDDKVTLRYVQLP